VSLDQKVNQSYRHIGVQNERLHALAVGAEFGFVGWGGWHAGLLVDQGAETRTLEGHSERK